ncbi:hypothetical protein DER44DRAFT_842185 [Fusarium oxysporum]|nr:hypothetical protein DER44DRAFT_842185 [Fusarium oxysporum]
MIGVVEMFVFISCVSESLHVTPDNADEQLRNVYDYIIVGGGTAGLTIANRLSENPAGLPPVPGKIGSGGWQKYQWGLTTEPQTYLNNPKVGIPQGKALGLPVIGDVNNGTAAGAMILPSSMQPDNQTRFDAREAHFNSASRRYHLHIATNQTVTQLVLDSNSAHNSSRRVMGVEFAPRNKSKARSISCIREVIVSAGAIFTPTLLQVSGIGPSDVLKSLDILVKIDLPGVGCNLQDHPMVYANYYYRNESYFRSNEIADGVYDEAAEEYIRNRTAPLINTIAFPSLRSATDDWKQFMNKSSGDGIPSNTPNSGQLTVAAQKTFSRVTVRPSSSSIFDLPKLDPRYCSDPIDCEIIVLGLQMNTKLIQTNAMKELMPEANRHPSGTAAMMPLELGGVADPELKVYGTCNLRIADASIMPLIPSAHLQASVYGIAEKVRFQ